MDETTQRTLAVWAVFAVSFVVLAGVLAARGELTVAMALCYWFTPVALVLVGAISPPWAPLVE